MTKISAEKNQLPAGWRIEKVADIGQWASGGTPSIKDETLWNGDIPWISAKDMKIPRLRDASDHVSTKAIGNGTRLIPPGSLLIVVRGMILAHTFPVALAESPLAFNQDLKALIPREDLSSEYLLYWFQANKETILSIADEATHGTKRIPTSALFNLPISLPPPNEQRAIASALSDIDALLARLDQLIAKKRDIKQAAMQELLTGRRRLPGFPAKWNQIKLGDVADIRTGKKNNEDKSPTGKHPFFVRSQTVERIDSYSFDGEAILIPGEGGIGTIIHYINGKFDYHQRVYKISNFVESISCKYVYYWMMMGFSSHAAANSVKATVDSLRLPTFKAFTFFAPSIEEQISIAAVISDMDTEIAALEARREKTRLIKQGMMQELLSGRVRLI